MTTNRFRHSLQTAGFGAVAIMIAAVGFIACGTSGEPSSLTAPTGASTTTTTVAGLAPSSTPHSDPASAPLQSGSHDHTITVDGAERHYLTYVPANLDTTEPAPLVVMLHGGFGSAEHTEQTSGWDAKADAEGFVVVYPEGNRKAWNAGDCCGPSAKSDVDDVAFITDVVEEIQSQAAIDDRRMYVTGMSNGAMMALRLACETNLFAAAAPVAGAVMVPCDDPGKTSIVHIHGSEDSNLPMDGSPGDGRGSVPAHTPVVDSIAQWRAVDECDTATERTEGDVTTSTATCPSNRVVTLITIEGAGHQWPGATRPHSRLRKVLGSDPVSMALDATDVIWEFFAAHPAPA